MLAERRYPLIRETLERMMELRLTAKSEGEAIFDLLRFIQKQIHEHQELACPEANRFCKELASPKQTTLGKDISNPLTVGSLLKTIWLLVHHVIAMKHWLFQSKQLLVGYSSVAEGDLRKFSDIGACTESTHQTLSLIEEYTPPVTYLKEVEKTLGTPIDVEPLNETKLEEVGLNCNHNTPLSSREVPSFDGLEPQPLLNNPSLDEMFDDDWGLKSKEVSPLGEELSLFDRTNKVVRGRILEAHRLEPILQQ
ncbi:hypothetical protein Tco_0678955 [Tanacetum coccineum]|uniref:Uncharacterized protein n=1 Tax=Tanacetum coccineum TaxID=301880 RepID=A0ABQ4XGH2_9ASTR